MKAYHSFFIQVGKILAHITTYLGFFMTKLLAASLQMWQERCNDTKQICFENQEFRNLCIGSLSPNKTLCCYFLHFYAL